MKRNDYPTRRERRAHQLVGFLAFPLVNVPLGIILWVISQRIHTELMILISVLPWLVNGIVIVLAFLLQPEFGVGYITFIGVAFAVVGGLSVLFVAACFVFLLSTPVLGDRAIAVFFVLMAVGVIVLVGIAIYVVQMWW